MPRLPDRRYHGRREETTANIVIESEPVSAEDAQEPISEESYSVEDILQEVHGQTPQEQKPQETQKRQETQKAQNVQEAQKMPQGGAVDSAQLLEGLHARGADYFILGCTELPIVAQSLPAEGPFVDPTEELARAAVRFCGYETVE